MSKKRRENETALQVQTFEQVFAALNNSSLTKPPFGIVLCGVDCQYKKDKADAIIYNVHNITALSSDDPKTIKKQSRAVFKNGENFLAILSSSASADWDARERIMDTLRQAGAVDIVEIWASPINPTDSEYAAEIVSQLNDHRTLMDSTSDAVFIFDEGKE